MGKRNVVGRFIIFGLWAQRCGLRAGFDEDESASLGHGTAIQFNVFKRGGRKSKGGSKPVVDEVEESRDLIQWGPAGHFVVYLEDGSVRSAAGGKVNTPEGFRKAIWDKVREPFRSKLVAGFDELLSKMTPQQASSQVYAVYDDFKKSCGVRLGPRWWVDMDELLAWLAKRNAKAA